MGCDSQRPPTLKWSGWCVETECMSTRRFRSAALAVVVCLLASACSSPEDQVRADMLAEGMSEESVDCIIDSFAEAGIDLEDSVPTSAIPTEAQAAMAGCLELMFNDVFSEGFAEMEADMADAFDDFDPDDAIAFNDSADVDMGALVSSCQAGDNAACDDLWLASPIGSAEEQIAENCGGRAQEKRMGSCEFWLD